MHVSAKHTERIQQTPTDHIKGLDSKKKRKSSFGTNNKMLKG